MFDFVRKHTKVMQLLLFVLIVPSFVLFGLEGYSRFSDKGEVVAKVDGREITQQQWDNAHKVEVDRIRGQMPTIDAKMLDSPQARYGTLEKLIRDRVLAAAADKSRLVVPDQRVARELQRNELVQSLRGPDGKLDIERYRQVLQAQGMTPEMYENQMRNDLSNRQVLVGVGASALAPAAQANVSLGSYFEKREVQLARFETAKFAAKVEPTEAEIEAYYKANPQLFQAPEQAAIEYVVLDLAAVQKGITLNEADLKTYYEQNAAQLASKEERRASHILLAAGKTASANEKEKAKAKAAELLAQLRKTPGSFAELAKKESQDPDSGKVGGDLDFKTRGTFVAPAMETTVFKLKKGEISDVVETEFGYHIIQLTDVKAPPQRTFEEMRPQLEADLKKQQAARKYAEAADTFGNNVYEQSDSLKPVSEKLKLEIKTAPNVSRTPVPGATGPLANPKFLNALFAPDSVERKRNTEAMEVGPNQMVSGRVSQYTPARARPLAEVKAQVREKLVAQRGAELAKKEGEAKLAAWKAAPATAELSAAMPMSRQDMDKQPRALVEAALRADPAALPQFTGVDLGADGYAVLKVVKVLPREAPVPAQAQAEQQQYLRAWAAAEAVSYYNALKDRYKVQILVAKPKDTLPQ